MPDESFIATIESTLERFRSELFVKRLWTRDATLWKEDEESKAFIRRFLGWLDCPEWMRSNVEDLVGFAEDVRARFDHVVLLGMGGSSLCPEVFARVFGRREGWPELIVLDSVVPEAVRHVLDRIKPGKTLVIVASKSGSTIEPSSLFKVFYDRIGDGRQFVAITDDDSPLESEAIEKGFRRVFINPEDIGGRYSALSYFGMVPAALMGLDVSKLLDRATEAQNATSSDVPVEQNAAAMLGAAMGTLADQGRDKVSLVTTRTIESLGLWIEQLVAESTGKEGKGILPIATEPILDPSSYGNDRFFVGLSLEGDSSIDATLDALEGAGHPVISLALRDRYDLAAQFFVWEIATALAGAHLGINPFDQPNVQAAKDRSKAVLRDLVENGVPETPDAIDEIGIRRLLAETESGDFVALLPYLAETDERNQQLDEIRRAISRRHGIATTCGYGPRYLHSTGQLHKGGANNGVFVVFTSDGEDVDVPSEDFSLGMLARAQALGDLDALHSAERRALHVHLGQDAGRGLERFLDIVR